jgi:hypothetical protein
MSDPLLRNLASDLREQGAGRHRIQLLRCFLRRFTVASLAILVVLSVSLALGEDFKTIKGKVYKDATISRVEPDGIVLRTKRGISKVYFIELPKDVQERFHPSPVETATAQREPAESKDQAGVMTNPIRFIIFFAAGLIITLAVVFVIILRGFR